MKILCFIAAIFVLLLSAKPCCADTDCSTNRAAGIKAPAQSSPKEKKCHGCSPFFSCGSCTGFVVARVLSYTLVLQPENPIEHVNTYRQPYLEDVALAIWQPPRLS